MFPENIVRNVAYQRALKCGANWKGYAHKTDQIISDNVNQKEKWWDFKNKQLNGKPNQFLENPKSASVGELIPITSRFIQNERNALWMRKKPAWIGTDSKTSTFR